jgi:hypothetical protein
VVQEGSKAAQVVLMGRQVQMVWHERSLGVLLLQHPGNC